MQMKIESNSSNRSSLRRSYMKRGIDVAEARKLMGKNIFSIEESENFSH
jgi:hypothetical protein